MLLLCYYTITPCPSKASATSMDDFLIALIFIFFDMFAVNDSVVVNCGREHAHKPYFDFGRSECFSFRRRPTISKQLLIIMVISFLKFTPNLSKCK